MSENILNSILEEEKKAAGLLLDAQLSANEIVKNAEARAAETEREAAVAHRALYQQALEERRQQVEARLAQTRGSQAEERKAFADEAGKKVSETAAWVASEVLHGAG